MGKKDGKGFFLFCTALGLLLTVGAANTLAAEQDRGFEPVLRKIVPLLSAQDALLVTASDGRILAAIGDEQLLVPASILKVLTALAALHYLGAEHRFATDFFLNPQGDLVVKGYGDPLLVSERLEVIARHLAGQIQQFGALVLDDSYFSHPIVIPGRGSSSEPYDAPNGALCVNFNTVFFKQANGRWVSAEPQTPLISSIIPKIKATGLKAGRVLLAEDRNESLRYAGELFAHFFHQAGMAMDGAITFGQANPEKDKLLWRHLSDKRLTDVIADLMAFSNNFIANQLLLAMGAQAHGAPATVDKGLRALRAYYQDTLGISTGFIDEASGLSRRNQVSAATMLFLLEKFAPHYRLLRHEGRQWYKTGTLKGIHTRVGYLESANGGHYRFVVMINTPGKTTDPILRILERELK